MKAVTSKRVEIVEFLLKAGADVNFKNKVCTDVIVIAINLYSTFLLVLACLIVCLEQSFHCRCLSLFFLTYLTVFIVFRAKRLLFCLLPVEGMSTSFNCCSIMGPTSTTMRLVFFNSC